MVENPTHAYLLLGRSLTLSFLVLLGAAASASAQLVFELRQDNTIWRYPGDQCNDTPCWTQIDTDTSTKTIKAGYGALLWQLRQDGTIWVSKGEKCDASGCHWDLVDKDTRATAITAGVEWLAYKLQSDGSIWRYMYPGQFCSPSDVSCPGWKVIGSFPKVAGILAFGSQGLYVLNQNAGIRVYFSPTDKWSLIDNKPTTRQIATTAFGFLYQSRDDGSIWEFTDVPCNKNGHCPGWKLRLIRNAANISIAAWGSYIYYLSSNGSISREPCMTAEETACSGWQTISNAKSIAIATGVPTMTLGGSLYRLDSDGTVWSFTGTPCDGGTCNGWQQIDKGDPKNPIKTIVAN